ncbi:MAG: hypothetical protein KF778_12565 [Rhodocyclaceae bacterium]|nr:hypothetical protein [Rhodocyclaceae bacterium]
MYFDRSGFCVWAKRLERRMFFSDWSRVASREMDWTGLASCSRHRASTGYVSDLNLST